MTVEKKKRITPEAEEQHYIRIVRLSLKEVIETDLAQFEGDGHVDVFRVVQNEARRGIIDLSRINFQVHWPREYGRPAAVAARLVQKGLIVMNDKKIELIQNPSVNAKPRGRGRPTTPAKLRKKRGPRRG
jgi:hypothetical protein